MTSKDLFRILKLAMTVGLLAYVLWKAGLLSEVGRLAFLDTIRDANWHLLAASVLFAPIMDLVSSIKWAFLAGALHLRAPLSKLFSYYLMGRFFNLVLPSNIGGDIIRIHLHGKACGQAAKAAAAVFMERFSGMMVLIALALVIAALESTVINIPFLTVSLWATLAAMFIGIWMLLDARILGAVRALTCKLLPAAQGLFERLEKFRRSVLLYRHAPHGLWLAVWNSLVFYLFAMLYVWLSVLAFDPEVGFLQMVVAVPLIMVMMNLPISIGGIGLMEFSYTVVLGAVGVSAEVALAVALLMRLHTLIAAAAGGLLYAVHHEPAAEQILHRPEQLVPNSG